MREELGLQAEAGLSFPFILCIMNSGPHAHAQPPFTMYHEFRAACMRNRHLLVS